MRIFLFLFPLCFCPFVPAEAFASQPPPAGCDTLKIAFRGKDKSFTSEMSQVEKRISEICDSQVPALNVKLSGLSKQCTGTFTSPSDARVDLMDENFRARTRSLCQFLKEAKSKIKGSGNSFCSRLAERSSRAVKLFTDADGAAPAGNQNEIIGRLTRQRDDYNATAQSFSGAASDANMIRLFIDRSLPTGSDPKSMRTEDPALHQLANSTLEAAAKQVAQIKSNADKLQKLTPRPANAAQASAMLAQSNQACGQLKDLLKKYVEAMENNLLPNGRMMSKLLSSAQDSAKKEAGAYTDSAAKITGTLQRLTIADLSQDPLAKTPASTITGEIKPNSPEAAQMSHFGAGNSLNGGASGALVSAQSLAPMPASGSSPSVVPNGSAAVQELLGGTSPAQADAENEDLRAYAAKLDKPATANNNTSLPVAAADAPSPSNTLIDPALVASAPASAATTDTASVVPAYQRTGSSSDDYNEAAYNRYEAAKPTYDSQIASGQQWLSKQGFFGSSYPAQNSGWVQDGSDPVVLRDNPGGYNSASRVRYFRYINSLTGEIMLLPGRY